MGEILIHNIDDTLLDILTQRASLSGRSIETEAYAALKRGVQLDAEERGALSRRLRAMTATNVIQSDSTAFIRQERDFR